MVATEVRGEEIVEIEGGTSSLNCNTESVVRLVYDG